MSQDNRNTLNVYLIVAGALAPLSSCPEWAAGAVIVKDGMIAGMANTAPPPGEQACQDAGGCDDEPVQRLVADPEGLGGKSWRQFRSCRRPMHAPALAILNAARKGQAVEGGALLCTRIPCHECMRLIVAAGIANVYALDDEAEDSTGVARSQSYGVPVHVVGESGAD